MENIFSPKNIKDIYPLSPMQEGMLFSTLLDEYSSMYFEQTYYTLQGKIKPDLLENALNLLMQRHDILRTIFNHTKKDTPLQVVLKERNTSIHFEDLGHLKTETEKQNFLELYKQDDQSKAFDLSKDVLCRVAVFQLNAETFEIVWSYHHIILDGWCVSVLLEEFLKIYQSLVNKIPLNLEPVKPYREYIQWLEKTDKLNVNNYWKKYLEDYHIVANLKNGNQNLLTESTTKSETINQNLPSETTKTLRSFAAQNHLTVSTILQTVWGIVLAKYNQTRDVVFGTVVSGRPAEIVGIERMIGLFVNTIPVRITYEKETTAFQLLKIAQQGQLFNEQNQHYPLAKIQANSELKNNLIDHVFVFESFPISQSFGVSSSETETLNVINVNTLEKGKFDFNFVVFDGEHIKLSLQYNPNVFKQKFIQNIAKQFTQILSLILQNAELIIDEISLISDNEKERILNFNQPSKSYIEYTTLHDLFEKQVIKSPDSVAIFTENQSMTYAELNQAASQFAWVLQHNYHIIIGDAVAVMMPRSVNSIIAILAIMKVGGVYVPINTDAPIERVKFVFEDASVQAVIIDSVVNKFNEINIPNIKFNEIKLENIVIENQENVVVKSLQDAYIIYTSGSTGVPKGVPVRHESILSRILYHNDFIGVNHQDTILQFAAHSFDASIVEIFMALLSGGKLFIASDEVKENTDLLSNFLEKFQVSTAIFPPSYLKIFKKNPLPTVRNIISTGEAAALEETLFYASTKHFYNGYGPTETCIGASFYKVEPSAKSKYLSQKSIPIGKPFADTKIYVLDNNLNIVPVGMEGEICVSGIGLTKGYLNNEALTLEKFVKNPFASNDTEKTLYRTGDLGMWNQEGELLYVGRKDEQVQIRGIRVELGEIENVIKTYEGIKEAVVLSQLDANNNAVLIAYIETHKLINTNDLREFLTTILPAYMFPANYVTISEWDVMKSGKIDRKKLASKWNDQTLKRQYQAPENETQGIIVKVWQEVLGKENIGINDNFFEIGGDSIKAIQIISRLYRMEYKADVKDLFKNPTPKDFALKLRSLEKTIFQGAVTGEVIVTSIQQEFFQTDVKAKNHFNQAVMLMSELRLETKNISKACTKLVNHHDALRMKFLEKSGRIIQLNEDLLTDFQIDFHDFTNQANPEKALLHEADALQVSFDLQKAPMLKVAHFRLPDADRLLIIIHHLVVDGISWRIILEDLNTLFSQLSNGKPLALPSKTDSFKKWASELQNYANSEKLLMQKDYWQTIESAIVQPLPMITENSHQKADFREVKFELNPEITTKLLEGVNAAFGTEINDILLTALGLAIRDVYGIDQTLLTLEGHGREDIIPEVDINRTVGWFTSTFLIHLNTNFENDLARQIIENKEMLRAIPDKGIGYGILKYLSQNTENQNIGFHKKPEILFNYLGQFDSDVPKGVFSVANEASGKTQADEYNALYPLSILGMVANHRLCMTFGYDAYKLEGQLVEKLVNQYQIILGKLIDFCAKQNTKTLTPSDLTHKSISIDALNSLQRKYDFEDIYRMTPMQEGMLFNSLLDKKSEAYATQVTYRFTGEFDAFITECSLNELFKRYQVLRTVFDHETTNELLQIVLKQRQVDFTFEDIRNLNQIDQEQYLEKFKIADRSTGFALSSDILMRISVLQMAENEYEFIWCNHHILMDGWCAGIFIAEFVEIYSCFIQKKKLNLSPVIPFKNYIEWLNSIDKKASENYWKQYLDNYTQTASLPKRAVPLSRTYQIEKLIHTLDKKQTKAFQDIAQQYQVTLNAVIQALWGILLSKLNGSNDVVFGTIVSGRPPHIEGIESMVGLFINTIPLRVKTETHHAFDDLLTQIHQTNIESETHHCYPLAEVQANTSLKQSLLDHILVFESYPLAEKLEGVVKNESSFSWEISSVKAVEQSSFDFELLINPSETLGMTFLFNGNVYDPTVIAQIKDSFMLVIEQVLQNNQLEINQIEIISENEKDILLNQLNDNQVVYSPNSTLVSLFEKQVQQTPSAIAIRCDGVELSYQQLDQKSNLIAHKLRNKYNTQTGDLVGILMRRNHFTIVSIMAILKAGAGYVPIDTDYPPERIGYILEDSKVSTVITEMDLFMELTTRFDGAVMVIDIESFDESIEPLNLPIAETELAYVIYTSGSTGKPKGVGIEHRNIVNYILWSNDYYFENQSGIPSALLTSLSFDLTLTSIFTPLLRGDMIVAYSNNNIADTLRDALDEKSGVKFIKLTPSHVRMIPHLGVKNTVISHIILGGEALLPEHISILRELNPNIKIYNEYGPTETTVGCSVELVSDNQFVSIGKPIANTKMYILDNHKKLVPKGLVGEIYVAGSGVGRGYLYRDEMTADKFTDNPFVLNQRMYRTGDLGKWTPDDRLEYLGRIDNQVKIRGYRIELGEIENALKQYSDIKEAVVIALAESENNKILVAYIEVQDSFPALQEIKDFLSQQLPEYMIPVKYIQVHEWILTANGKLDKNKLPSENQLIRSAAFEEASTEIEHNLVNIWQEVLEKQSIGIHDNYFELGGDSIKAIQVVSRMYRSGYKIEVIDIFNHPTVATLSKLTIMFDNSVLEEESEETDFTEMISKDDLSAIFQ